MRDRRVLIMDDDESMRGVLLRFLARNGWQAVAASNAEAAMRVLKAAACFAAILDVESESSEDGFAAARKLLALEPALRVVMMSGNPIYAERARAAGYPFLSKPFNLAELLNILGGAEQST
ncbi:MAG: response regulator [Candidatus Terrybacteria bacterium]|nr:response regulator [Candidatus Terrybacteria bacterium]